MDKSFRVLLSHPSLVASFQILFDHFRTEYLIQIPRHGNGKGTIQNAIKHRNEIWQNVRLSILKYKRSKIAGNRTNAVKKNIFSALFAVQIEYVLKLC